MMNDWIEIFRAGDYGHKGRYSERDLDSIITNYQRSTHEAPVVLGHPDNNARAYGRVKSLKRSGKTLFAKFREIAPQLEDHVRAGRFKKRSAAFSQKPDGSLSLRHVGFLGATAPEVKGMADVAVFAENNFTEIEFSTEGTMNTDAATKARQAIDTLKQRGHWRDDYERRGLPAIFLHAARSEAAVHFGECGSKPMLQALADVVARVTPKIINGTIVDSESEEFADEVQKFATRKNIPYGEAAKAVRAKRQLRAVCVEFVDNNLPFMQGMYDKATQLSNDQNIPYGRALIGVLDDHGYPWRKVSNQLMQLNTAYTKDDDPAQLQEEAQKRATDEGISLEKATQQIELEHEIEKSHRAMFGPHNA